MGLVRDVREFCCFSLQNQHATQAGFCLSVSGAISLFVLPRGSSPTTAAGPVSLGWAGDRAGGCSRRAVQGQFVAVRVADLSDGPAIDKLLGECYPVLFRGAYDEEALAAFLPHIIYSQPELQLVKLGQAKRMERSKIEKFVMFSD